MKSENLQPKMHDYLFYSIAAVLYFIIFLDVRRSDKELKKQKRDKK
jgi:hypothetical protein